ncbi:MAG: hypothetical protein R2861_03865 [Desulfobacterales bacterium]
MPCPMPPSSRAFDCQKEGKKNIFSGRIIEFEGGPELSVAQAYELTNASAERSAAAPPLPCPQTPANYLQENIGILNKPD